MERGIRWAHSGGAALPPGVARRFCPREHSCAAVARRRLAYRPARTPPRWPSAGKGAFWFAPCGAVHRGFAVRDRALGRSCGPELRERVSAWRW